MIEILPSEILVQIISYLTPKEIALAQSVCLRFFTVCRDKNLWKSKCFLDSRAEALRKRQELIAVQEPGLAALRRAMDDLHNPNPSDLLPTNSSNSYLDTKARTLANWDPEYPNEEIDYYQEYVQRHAPIRMNWLSAAVDDPTNEPRESIGIGVLEHGPEKLASKVISPLDDGSICIWDVRANYNGIGSGGTIIARSDKNLVFDSGRLKISNETGAVDNVSVDSTLQKAYIAAFDYLNEVDLQTFQIVRRQKFPFPITCLSEARHPIPLTVGTNMTVHLYDTRDVQNYIETDHSTRCEIIAGTIPVNGFSTTRKLSAAHAFLSQPGPLSILHMSGSATTRDFQNDIWIAGRFTSLLNYDRRFWPRIKGTVFSGARLSSIGLLQYPYLPQELDLLRNEGLSIQDRRKAKFDPACTLIAAGEYKGKGSLELYGLMNDSSLENINFERPNPRNIVYGEYRNRQTVSKSRLLSVCYHGAKIVFSDGDGNLKWVERDGVTGIRSININAESPELESSLFSNATSEEESGDIIQKIIPAQSGPFGATNQGNLLLWSGDGRIGMVTFGAHAPWVKDESDNNSSNVNDTDIEHEQALYAQRMRRALERQAIEARLVRILGVARER